MCLLVSLSFFRSFQPSPRARGPAWGPRLHPALGAHCERDCRNPRPRVLLHASRSAFGCFCSAPGGVWWPAATWRLAYHTFDGRAFPALR